MSSSTTSTRGGGIARYNGVLLADSDSDDTSSYASENVSETNIEELLSMFSGDIGETAPSHMDESDSDFDADALHALIDDIGGSPKEKVRVDLKDVTPAGRQTNGIHLGEAGAIDAPPYNSNPQPSRSVSSYSGSDTASDGALRSGSQSGSDSESEGEPLGSKFFFNQT